MIGQGFAYKDSKGNALTFRIAHFVMAALPERIEHAIDITRQFMEERKG